MFRISAKGVYGLTAVLELGLNRSRGALQIRDIAEAHGIPQHYLEQLLVNLKRAGFVKSFRGSQGGYALAEPPSRIKVHDVLACLEGKLEVVSEQYFDGALEFYWRRIEKQLMKVLDISLEELILEKQHAGKQFTYSI